jgi:hypothetical protein
LKLDLSIQLKNKMTKNNEPLTKGDLPQGWRKEYNCFRPHSSLDGMMPDEVVKMYQIKPKNSTLRVSEIWE